MINGALNRAFDVCPLCKKPLAWKGHPELSVKENLT